MYKDFVKKGVVWGSGALGAFLAANGVLSVEVWNGVMTPMVIDGLAGAGGLVIGAAVMKASNWFFNVWAKV